MKNRKSYTRRYYEDLIERFEQESKWVDDQKKLDEKKEELTLSLHEGYELQVLTQNELMDFLRRVDVVKVQRAVTRQNLQQTITMNAVTTAARNRLVQSEAQERNKMSLNVLKAMVEEQGRQRTETSGIGSSKEEIIKSQDNEEELKTKHERERENKVFC